jgi:hypothetical protein
MQNTASHDRPTISLSAILILGFAAGIWTAWQGLATRLTGHVPFAFGRPELWATLAAAGGLDLAAFGWPMVIVGTSWWGAILGLWIHNKWGWPVTLIVALLSLLHAWEITLMAAAVLVLLFLPSVRRWGRGE